VSGLEDLLRSKQQGLFEPDFRLRPWGKNAALPCPLDLFRSYYGPAGEAHNLERIALTRLRSVAGDVEFGRQVELLRDQLVYEGSWLDLEQLSEVRSRQFRQKEAGLRNAKYSPGGLVDVEYGVQILQVRHGRDNPSLRTPDLDVAIDRLAAASLLDPSQAAGLHSAYRFLRRLVNALRMLRGMADDLFLPPPETAEARHLARRMGYLQTDWRQAAEHLERDFEAHTGAVRTFVRSHVGAVMLPARSSILSG
jgi:glutamate-ammonia-ligase adenylyltransferase